ncbi:uncharacterized protein LOC131861136 [Cryptomeria japonica]|uniref:uncharacterized protein LOC131861136 n=1 Tax=Cryptomeria japonica TaxID=3369 RepID=UPI0027DA23EA|nr:uncharacterized protein LOC131861136 [Cryptomeria japonica]
MKARGTAGPTFQHRRGGDPAAPSRPGSGTGNPSAATVHAGFPCGHCGRRFYPAATVNGNPGKSGIGVVIFEHNSKIVKVVGKSIGIGSNNVAEFQALSFGLDLAISLDIKDIIMEGDSMLVFQLDFAKKCVSWHLQYLLERILAQLKHFYTFTISHYYREINVIADYLANRAIVECVEYLEVPPRDIPTSCISILL